MESMVIFWGAFFFFRGFGYYQQFREKETVAARLEAQLANSQIAALRMQLNPHFLFNTMNSISSLMRSDIDAADSMLEQMSSLLRMTLERRDVQLIPLHDEIEFIETYLGMQDRRYAGRVIRTLSVDPELHDALVPAMYSATDCRERIRPWPFETGSRRRADDRGFQARGACVDPGHQ